MTTTVKASEGLDVLICGAGPVGLTLASQLHRHGLSFRIIDRNESRTLLSKALVVWARSLELLSTGLDVRSFQKAGIPAEVAEIRAGDRVVARIDLTRQNESPYGCGVMIPQSETERLLEEHLVSFGGHVERRTELFRFTDLGDRVRCTLHGHGDAKEVIEPAFLVGCDGAHSVVRHGLGLEFRGDLDHHRWYLADVHVAGDMPEATVLVCWHRAGLLVFFRIRDDRWRVIAALDLADANAPRQDPTLEDMQTLVDERGPSGLRLHDPVWLAEFRINERKVDRYRVGRVAVVGDAAHVHSPAGGQGMNTGMQDACNLAWKLALVRSGVADIGLLDTYTNERSAVGDLVLQAAGRVTDLATLRNPIAQHARNLVASAALHLPFVQDRARKMLSEMSIAYPRSPLTGADGRSHRSGGPAPGERLPDAALRTQADEPKTLYSLLESGKILTLLFPGEDPAGDARFLREQIAESWQPHVLLATIVDSARPALEAAGAADATLVDPGGALAQALGFRAPGFAVIRPDGYVALFADVRATSLRDWLFLVESGVPTPEHALSHAS